MQVQQYLRQNHVPFDLISHPSTFGALRVAQSTHTSGNEMAKSVILEADGEPMIAVLPATRRVDFADLREILGAKEVTLADEERCRELFRDCELGALPPFGGPRGMRTLMDQSLRACDRIVCEGNRHDEAIRLGSADYERLEHPLIAAFSKE